MPKKLRIQDLHCFAAIDENGDEGIMAFTLNGMWHPMVCADAARIESMRPIALQLAQSNNRTVKLLRFGSRQDIETIHEVKK